MVITFFHLTFNKQKFVLLRVHALGFLVQLVIETLIKA